MTYRSDVDALAARQAALEFEVAAATKARDAAGRLLDEARERARLPILDNIRVATPCHADWNQMTGDPRARLCGACDKHVYNISGLTRDEAEALIIDKEGQLCVRYFQRSDGTMLLADCEVGKKQKRGRRVIVAGAAAMLTTAGLLAVPLRRHVELQRIERAPTPLEKALIPIPPLPPHAAPIERPMTTMGVPPPPSAEDILRYKQLKTQSKAKKAHHP